LPFQGRLFQMHAASATSARSSGVCWARTLSRTRSNLLDAGPDATNYLGDRWMQVDIIKREFPRLATLPLDAMLGPDYLVTPCIGSSCPLRKFLDCIARSAG
jgi:hypothetical protein